MTAAVQLQVRTKMSGVCTDDGECMGSPELRLLKGDLLTIASGTGEGHPFATQR